MWAACVPVQRRSSSFPTWFYFCLHYQCKLVVCKLVNKVGLNEAILNVFFDEITHISQWVKMWKLTRKWLSQSWIQFKDFFRNKNGKNQAFQRDSIGFGRSLILYASIYATEWNNVHSCKDYFFSSFLKIWWSYCLQQEKDTSRATFLCWKYLFFRFTSLVSLV